MIYCYVGTRDARFTFSTKTAHSVRGQIGLLLGNGRDRGLLGVTFKLEGDADSPDVSINPLSIVAPGIFRSIFEFR